VARLRYGRESMRPFLGEARTLLAGRRDFALEVDVGCMELLASDDADETARVREELLALHRQSGIERVWLRAAGHAAGDGFSMPPGTEALEEDRLGALYVACLRPSPELAEHLIESGHWGLLPVALALAPGKRLLLFGRRLVLEDQGNVSVSVDPPEGTLRLLSALASGALHSKEELLAQLWGIGAYRPDAHDPVIHTAVSRLRAQLGVRGHWVEAAAGGYRLAPGVEVQTPFRAATAEPLPPGLLRPSPLPVSDGARGSLLPAADRGDAVLTLLAQKGPASSTDVASHLGVSEMTALRRLREYVEHGAVSRDGKGKNTRYRLTGGLP
jgi:hypothetical protein